MQNEKKSNYLPYTFATDYNERVNKKKLISMYDYIERKRPAYTLLDIPVSASLISGNYGDKAKVKAYFKVLSAEAAEQ